MKNNKPIKRAMLISLLIGVGSIAAGLFPGATYAEELVVRTTQVIPPGANTCAPLSTTGFKAFVYDNALHSFEFFVNDLSYVAIGGTVGDRGVPFNQISRGRDAAGNLRVHVDIATTPVRGTLPVSVTLISSGGAGQPVCISTVTTSVISAAASGGTSGGISSSPAGGVGGAMGSGGSGSGGKSSGGSGVSRPSTGSSATGGSTTTAAGSASVPGPAANLLQNACSSVSSASRVWLVLLALYALIAGVAATGQLQLSVPRAREWTAGIIVAPFILLFGIWYFVESCRPGIWAPLLSLLIACAGLAGAYWNQTTSSLQVIPLPASRTPEKQPPKPATPASPIK